MFLNKVSIYDTMASEFNISKNDLEKYGIEFNVSDKRDSSMLDKITNYVIDNVPEIKRGDIVSVIPEDERYRNDGLFIWNGEKVIELDFSIDEYGSVPPEFIITYTEFSVDWWRGIIKHNGYIWPSKEIRKKFADAVLSYNPQKLLDNLQFGQYLVLNEVEFNLDDNHYLLILSDVDDEKNPPKEEIMKILLNESVPLELVQSAEGTEEDPFVITYRT